MSIFGNTGAASTNPLFGGKPATNIFGSSTTTTPAAPAAPAATSNLFSAFGKPSTPTPAPASGQPATGAPAVGAAPSNIFGGTFASTTAPAANAPANPFLSTASATSATPAPSATGNIFGKPLSSTNAAGSSGSVFGGPSTQAAPSTDNSQAGKGLGGLFGIQAAAEKKDAPSTSTSAAPGAPSVPSFLAVPGTSSTPKPEEKKPAGSSIFGALSQPAAKEGEKSNPLASAPALGASTSNALGAAAAPAASTTTAAASVSVAPPSILKGKSIEEIVNKWSSELETQVTEFNKLGGEVAAWDRALIENGNNLAALYSHVLALESDQNEVDEALSQIEQQQRDLTSTLESYENISRELFGSQGGSLRALDSGPADTERDKNYMLATDLYTHLDDLSTSLTQMIENVNALSLPASQDPSEADQPMSQIAQILSSHLESLQWIDSAVREVEGKVTDVEKRMKESNYGPGNLGQRRGFNLR